MPILPKFLDPLPETHLFFLIWPNNENDNENAPFDGMTSFSVVSKPESTQCQSWGNCNCN